MYRPRAWVQRRFPAKAMAPGWRRGLIIGWVLVLPWLCGCQPQGTPSTQRVSRAAPAANSLSAADRKSIDRVAELIHERLNLMHDVARCKWNADQPIADAQRERELIDGLVAYATSRNLDAQFATELIRGQIEAGKRVQQFDITRWQQQHHAKFREVRDLKADLRPEIDGISRELLRLAGELEPKLSRGQVRRALQKHRHALKGRGIDETTRRLAYAALLPDD